jgi:hypothetical protein
MLTDFEVEGFLPEGNGVGVEPEVEGDTAEGV